MPMLLAFCLYNLCKHPEYLEPLRDEISRSDGAKHDDATELPLLDSFLKETTRMNPITISNNWIMVAQQVQMKDPYNYPDPETFNDLRFVKQREGRQRSNLRVSVLSAKLELHFVGLYATRMPGRSYVSHVLKSILKEFIMEYDIKLADENVRSSFSWGMLRLPHPRLAFVMKKRSV